LIECRFLADLGVGKAKWVETRRGRQRLHTKKTRDLVMTMYIVRLAVTVTAEETPERGGEVRLGR
jgi:hypothetical protein